jgi:protein SCO1/2
MMISTIRNAAAAVLIAGAASLLAAGAAADPWGPNFPNVPLTTQDGKTVRFYDDLLKGKKVVINVIFTVCTDVCPLETANLVQLTKLLGDRVGRDVFFYSISIDPLRDTPPVLKAYAEKFGAGGPGWLFLTGKAEDIKLITKKLALIRDRDNPTSRESHHAPYLVLGIEPSGLWTRKHATTNPRFLASTMNTFFSWPETEPQKSYAEARPLQISEGQRLFVSRCNSCHTIGQGDKIGPDLRGVTDRRERTWLTRYIADAPQVLSSGDPVAAALHNKYRKVVMPYLGLSASQVAEVVSFLDARDAIATKKSQKDTAHAGH